ncbi:antibiotic biosynthesis monooxygenase [Vibrio kasasachensis]|uniref:putative quinol monooxygenase n=1 Tax=Vibrio kasasachensis TaxID=2910248 RepID=UPI003D0A433C
MAKVTLQGFILVPENELEAVKNELINHKRLTLEEAGCLTFSVTESPNNPCCFDVYEEFESKLAFEAHQTRVQSSYWGKVTVNVERYYEIFE